MALGHIDYNQQSAYGNQLKSAIDRFLGGLDDLVELKDTLIQMKDGGSFTTYALTKFGFPTTVTADAALAEIEAALNKVTVNTSVQDTATALKQLGDKFR
jgi:hypothetical protein